MGLISDIAEAARLGDLAAINKLLDESPEYGERILRGRARADQRMGRDKLPQLAEPMKIGLGQPPLPSIYPQGFSGHRETIRKSRRRRTRAA